MEELIKRTSNGVLKSINLDTLRAIVEQLDIELTEEINTRTKSSVVDSIRQKVAAGETDISSKDKFMKEFGKIQNGEEDGEKDDNDNEGDKRGDEPRTPLGPPTEEEEDKNEWLPKGLGKRARETEDWKMNKFISIEDNRLSDAFTSGDKLQIIESLKAGATIDVRKALLFQYANTAAEERTEAIFRRENVREADWEEFRHQKQTYKLLKMAELTAEYTNSHVDKAIQMVEERAFQLSAAKVDVGAAKLLSGYDNPLLNERREELQTALKAVNKSKVLTSTAIELGRTKVQKVAEEPIVCNYCKKTGHRMDSCRKREGDMKKNKADASYYQFFLKRGRVGREKEASPLYFQPMARVGKKWSFKLHCEIVKGGCSCRGRGNICAKLQPNKHSWLVRRRENLCKSRITYLPSNRSVKTVPGGTFNSGKVSSSAEERCQEISVGGKLSTVEQTLQDPQVQIQNVKKVLRTNSIREDLLCHLRLDGRVSSNENQREGSRQVLHRMGGKTLLLHCTPVWVEWESLFFYDGFERVCKNSRKRRFGVIQLPRRLFRSAKRRYGTGVGLISGAKCDVTKIRSNKGTHQGMFLPISKIHSIRNLSGHSLIKVIHTRRVYPKDNRQMQGDSDKISYSKENLCQGVSQGSGYCYCIRQLFSTGCSGIESTIYNYAPNGEYIWLGWRMVIVESGSGFCITVDIMQSTSLEWSIIQISFVDYRVVYRCFFEWLWYLLSHIGSQYCRIMERFGHGETTYKRVGNQSSSVSASRVGPKVTRSMCKAVYGFKGWNSGYFKREIDESSGQESHPGNLENNIHIRHTVMRCNMVVFSRKPGRGQIEQARGDDNKSGRSRGLDGNRQGISKNTTSTKGKSQYGQICKSQQPQNRAVHGEIQVTEESASRRVQLLLERGYSQQVRQGNASRSRKIGQCWQP